MKCPKCKHEWQHSGVKPQLSEKQIRQAFARTKGNISQAARLTGVKIVSFQARCRKLGLRGSGYRKKHRFEHVSNSQIAKAWLDFGNAVKAADSLGMGYEAFRSRLVDTKEHRADPTRFRGIKAKKRTVVALGKELAKHNWNYSETALALGVSRERIRQLVERDVIGGLKESAK